MMENGDERRVENRHFIVGQDRTYKLLGKKENSPDLRCVILSWLGFSQAKKI